MKKIRNNAEGFTLIELLIVVAIIGIIAAIAIPGLLRARMSGNEASAIGTVRALNSAEATFAASCAGGGYAGSVDDLADGPGTDGEPFISPDLATGSKSGYAHAVEENGSEIADAAICNDAETVTTGFFAEAHPVEVGQTGQRSFGIDQRGTIFQDSEGGTFADATELVAGESISVLQ